MKEALVLAGGASSRMGTDKARLTIEGVPLVQRIAEGLATDGWDVTVVGGFPVDGHRHRPDEEAHAGPLSALRSCPEPQGPRFVCSCDLPLFRPIVATALMNMVGRVPVVPVVAGRPQPLCAVYPESAFLALKQSVNLVRVLDWLALTGWEPVEEGRLLALGVDPGWLANVNTPDEYASVAGSVETPMRPPTN